LILLIPKHARLTFKEKYGPYALVAGASEGMGAAWAETLAKRGLNLVLLARRKELLEKHAASLDRQYNIHAMPVVCDLSDADIIKQVQEAIGGIKINFLVYNAVLPYIGSFDGQQMEMLLNMEKVNMSGPMQFAHHFGKAMLAERRGGVVLMSSIAGFQGSGFLSMYAATKAFNRVLAEGLWYEWKEEGVDVIACCAGATSTPN
jgi:short-subunit dehydrogenase